MTNLTQDAQEMPSSRRERSERSDEGISCGQTAPPEVSEKAKRRRYTAEYKMRILEETEQCHMPGQVGILLRREGLYSSILYSWRKWRNQMEGKTPKPRTQNSKALHNEIARLKRKNDHLSLKLKKAEGIIHLQKKISEMMDLNPPDWRDGKK